MAKMDFKPWRRSKGGKPPAPDLWSKLWNPHGVNMRFAWEICHKTKPQLFEIARKIQKDDKTGRAFMTSYLSSIAFLEDMLKLLEAAEARFLSAASVVELEAERKGGAHA
jgi:hypothetical protein